MTGRRLLLRALALTALVQTAACRPIAPAIAQSASHTSAALAPTVVLVIRHAEKAGEMSADPALTPAGVERAAALAAATRHLRLGAVFSTQFIRTRETARPVAEAAGLSVTIRPASGENATTYAADLTREILGAHVGKTVLVVGHSNTVPGIVQALSGRMVDPIADPQYGDLYTIIIPAGATPSAAVPAAVLHTKVGR